MALAHTDEFAELTCKCSKFRRNIGEESVILSLVAHSGSLFSDPVTMEHSSASAVPHPPTSPLDSNGTGTASETRSKTVSVMSQVNQRKRSRRRRRGGPPLWVTRLSQTIRQARTFFKESLPSWIAAHREELASCATSFAVLTIVAIVMALWILPPASGNGLFDLIVSRTETDLDDLTAVEIDEIIQPDAIQDLDVNSNLKQMLSELEDGETSDEFTSPEDRDFAWELEPTEKQLDALYREGDFGGRSTAGKQAALKRYGGTAASEQAVSSGLKWLKGLQQKDGSWSFARVGRDAAAGDFQRTEVGATSLALLCFLGAGHTHLQEGPYQETVRSGLAYMGSQIQVVQGTADLRGTYEGHAGMYVQGLAAICISEAHALEPRDEDLEKVTEMAVAFIERAQDPIGGGWRYNPRDPGDTSVVGWQVMALQSAKAGRVRVSSKTLKNTRDFLRDARGDADGSTYKYRPEDNRPKDSMTAVGLLCRMYLGWGKDHEALGKGVHRLATIGPSTTDMYYNYYAAQVMHHWGGELWDKWNLQMREQLVKSQIGDGPAAGSWKPTDNFGRRGGQLYQTALSILTLEVYYRHLPIYRRLENGPTDPTTVE